MLVSAAHISLVSASLHVRTGHERGGYKAFKSYAMKKKAAGGLAMPMVEMNKLWASLTDEEKASW